MIFFLNLGVYKFQEMVAQVAGADYPIRFEYGRPKKAITGTTPTGPA